LGAGGEEEQAGEQTTSGRAQRSASRRSSRRVGRQHEGRGRAPTVADAMALAPSGPRRPGRGPRGVVLEASLALQAYSKVALHETRGSIGLRLVVPPSAAQVLDGDRRVGHHPRRRGGGLEGAHRPRPCIKGGIRSAPGRTWPAQGQQASSRQMAAEEGRRPRSPTTIHRPIGREECDDKEGRVAPQLECTRQKRYRTERRPARPDTRIGSIGDEGASLRPVGDRR